MDNMDIYVSPDDDGDCDTVSTRVEDTVNPHRVVWLKCKAKAEQALNLIKHGREESTSEQRDNINKPMNAPLMPEQDTKHQKDHFKKMDNDVIMTSLNDSFGQTTVTMHAPTVEHLDLQDRDPTDMNKHVRIWFEDVLAEPEGMHSFDRVWRASYITFTTVKFWCYRFCALLCGVPFAICWGVYFACLTFLHVWYVVPCIKSCMIVLHWASKMWTICIRSFCDPCWESFGKVFSNIQLTNCRQ